MQEKQQKISSCQLAVSPVLTGSVTNLKFPDCSSSALIVKQASKQTNEQTKKLTANKQKTNLSKSTKTSRLNFGNSRKLDQRGKGTASKSTNASMTGAYKNRDHGGSQSKSLKSQLKRLIHMETHNHLRSFLLRAAWVPKWSRATGPSVSA